MMQEATPLLEPIEAETEPAVRVLIVEDDPAQAHLLAYRLRGQGFQTIEARSGGEALELARKERPEIVLLDIGLPDLDGFHVCSALVDDPRTASIPVIIVSGMDEPDVVRRSRAAGCTYYIRKPYDPNTLLTLIQQAIRDAQQW